MKNKKGVYSQILILIFLFGFGIFIGYQIRDLKINEHQGYFNAYFNASYPQFSSGLWACVNVQDISYERGVEVCQHEIGHAIYHDLCKIKKKNILACNLNSEEFAEICESNFIKCNELLY